jgi:hypothetical protein
MKHSRKAGCHPVFPFLHCIPKIDNLQVHLFAQRYTGVRVQTASFVCSHDLAQNTTAAYIHISGVTSSCVRVQIHLLYPIYNLVGVR